LSCRKVGRQTDFWRVIFTEIALLYTRNEYKYLLIEKHNGIVILTLNRPNKLNAINIDMSYEIHSALDSISSDKDCLVLIITGSGRGFCSGWDINEDNPSQENSESNNITNISQHIIQIPQPVIAAINGIAAGIGLSIAMSADIRIAAENSQFSCIFVKRSLVPDGGATLLLQRLLGKGIAMEMSLTGNIYDSDWALHRGLVNRVTQNSLVLHSAVELGSIITNNPPAAVRAIKRIMNKIEPLLSGVIESENEANSFLVQTNDFQESILSFEEKRPPLYRDA